MAAFDAFLKIETIDGESSARGHEKEIQIDSFSWGMTNPGGVVAGGGGSSGRVSVEDIHFGKTVDASSPKLMLACATGRHIGKATLTVRKAGGQQQEFYKVELQNIMVTSFHSADSGESVPTDQFSLNYGKISFSYSPQTQKGDAGSPITADYDVSGGNPS